MEPGPYEKVPLSADEKGLLMNIYRSRRKFVLIVYSFLFVAGLILSGNGIDKVSRRTGRVSVKWEDRSNPDAKFVSRVGMRLINILLLESTILGTGVFYLFRKVLPYKRDALSGLKEKVPYIVIRKEYFPLTSQYFAALNDPDYLHNEIDEETYHNLWEGCTIYLNRAVRSKYVFEENGRFTL